MVLRYPSVFQTHPPPLAARVEARGHGVLRLQQPSVSRGHRLRQHARVSVFDDAAAFHHQDAIESARLRDIVCHIKQRARRPAFSCVCEQLATALTLESHERLVKHHQPRIVPEHCPGKSRTLRFAWHLTTVAWFGLAAVLLAVTAGPAAPAAPFFTDLVAVVALVSALVAAAGSRGRHLSWLVFLAIGVLAWWGGR